MISFPTYRQRTLRARRNCVTEKKPNSPATQTASAISQCATSRVHARTAELSQASDGSLYGTTLSGGSLNDGTVFRIGQDGNNYTVLNTLSAAQGPAAALTEGTDGLLYGTTQLGGASGAGSGAGRADRARPAYTDNFSICQGGTFKEATRAYPTETRFPLFAGSAGLGERSE